MTFPEALTAIRDIGLPGALLLAICYAVWKWGWFLCTDVIKPVSIKAIECLQHVMESITKLVDSSDRMCGQMERQGEEIVELRKDHGAKLDDHGRMLNELITERRGNRNGQ